MTHRTNGRPPIDPPPAEGVAALAEDDCPATIRRTLSLCRRQTELLADALQLVRDLIERQTMAASPAVASGEAQPYRHSPDFRAVHWHGYAFRFSKTQAAVVEALDLLRHSGQRDLCQAEILRRVGSECLRLSDLFRRDDGRRAWGVFIIPGDLPGSYRLADAPPGRVAQEGGAS